MTAPPPHVKSDRDPLSLVNALVYLVVLWMGYLVAGWILAAYNAPKILWIGTLAATMHLAWAGTGAIALAMVWILALIWIAALAYAQPLDAPWTDGRSWAESIFRLWLRGIIFVLLLGFSHRFFTPWGLSRTQSFGVLLSITWSALGFGALMYRP
ncbi:MAG: hypothetical protein WCD18_19575 [Thermosynechococcaceae cyanobacterium]